MSEGSSSPKRARLDFDDNLKDDHYDKYKNRDQEDQGSYTHSRRKRGEPDDDDLKDNDEVKAKNVPIDPGRREHTLVMRLTNKEQELQECMNQIQEMKQAQTQNTAQLRSMLLDPAINLVFQRMAREMDEHKEKLKQKQNELSAWKFTPDSQTGMRLMAKCRMLLQENGELGKMISSGRTARLEGEISLQKALVTEMKKNQKELDEFVGELEEDVESMQGMILMLQQQLKEAKELNLRLQQENEQLKASQIPAEPGGLTSSKDPSSDVPALLSKPILQVNSLMSQLTHRPSLLGDGSKDVEQTPAQKTPGNCGNPVDSSVSGSLSDYPLITSQASPDNLSPPAFKVTPDSGTQTQEEDNVSVDAADFPLTGGALKQEQTSPSSHNPAQADLDAAASRSAVTAQSKGLLPSLQDGENAVQDSLSLESEHDSEKVANLLDGSNTHCPQSVRTSPPLESDALRTDPLADPSQKNNLSGNVTGRTITASAPSNGGDVLTLDADSDNLLNRTSCVDEEEEVVNSVDKQDEVSKRSDCGDVSVVDKSEGDSKVECPFQLGMINGSSKGADGPDL